MQERLLFGFLPIYGMLIAGAIGLGVFLCGRQEGRLGLAPDTAVDFALWVIPAAILGARLYYVAFQWPLYASDPVRILYIWEGGLAIYGGVIGGAAAAFLFSRVKKIPFGVLADMTAPSLILGQAIGRWGNFVNGEAYGGPVTDPALQFFPLAVRIGDAWHMATFFYESAWDFLGFLLLWGLRKRLGTRGSLFLCYLCWYGFGRAVIEGLREDSLMWGSVRVSQLLSVLLCAGAGAALLILLIRKRRASRGGRRRAERIKA